MEGRLLLNTAQAAGLEGTACCWRVIRPRAFRATTKRKGSIGKRLPAQDEKAMEINKADVAELVDARDLKSLDGNVVRVRVPPPAPRMGSSENEDRRDNGSEQHAEFDFSAPGARPR
jgi:hypothetical protein